MLQWYFRALADFSVRVKKYQHLQAVEVARYVAEGEVGAARDAMVDA